jgi:hypothetical protein
MEERLFPAHNRHQLGIGKAASQQRLTQGARPERIAEFQPVATLRARQIGQFEVQFGHLRGRGVGHRRILDMLGEGSANSRHILMRAATALPASRS